MLWFDEIAEKVRDRGPQLINDSKTPSGRVHVGALRGVLIHDAVYKTLQRAEIPVRYMFGVDNYDPFDELPAGRPEYEPYLGQPLANVPAPPGSDAANIGDYYMSEFLEVFARLDVEVELYHTADIYLAGDFNEEIDVILSHAAEIRDIYRKVSGSQRPDDWYPFQVICESCGRIGTTKVTDYDGKEVTYTCEPKLVTWATGCGHRGKMSPFDGRGKLPWKLEWSAKWNHFGISIEGAGKDHCTKGGSNDVASNVLRRVFKKEAPLNIPYEFFLVGGAKMSSSKGLGVSAKEMADFLPPEVLRFLVLSRRPNQQVNFTPDKQTSYALYDRFDRTRAQALRGDEDANRILDVCGGSGRGTSYLDFQLLSTLMQIPNVDLVEEAGKRKDSPLDDAEKAELERRVTSARYWLDHYATEEDRIEVQQALPERAGELDHAQRGFMHRLADAIETIEWNDQALQVATYDAARHVPLPQPRAFAGLYRTLLDRASGPRAGGLLSVLDRPFVLDRLRALPYSEVELLAQTAEDEDAIRTWIGKSAKKLERLVAAPSDLSRLSAEEAGALDRRYIDLHAYLAKGREQKKRLAIDRDQDASAVLAELGSAHGVEIEFSS